MGKTAETWAWLWLCVLGLILANLVVLLARLVVLVAWLGPLGFLSMALYGLWVPMARLRPIARLALAPMDWLDAVAERIRL